MADVVKFLDGSIEVMLEGPREFLERCIREKLGDDVLRIFKDVISEFDDDLHGWRCQAEDAENIADDYLAMCRGAVEGLQAIYELAQTPRIDKGRLLRTIDNEIRKINRNL